MKFIFFFLFLASSTSFALTELKSELAHVEIQNHSVKDRFWIQEMVNGKALVTFQQNHNSPQKREISLGRARMITHNLTHVYWESQYRKPVSSIDCIPYGKLRITGEKMGRVCIQQAKQVGEFSGLLSELQSFFRDRASR